MPLKPHQVKEKILCIETSTSVCSVALSIAGEAIEVVELSSGMQHGEQITLLIKQCMELAGLRLKELDAIAVSSGPGSYTGLRIGVSTAKGLCMAIEKPLIAIGSLEVLAYSTEWEDKDTIIMPMIDARRMEVYTCTFDHQHQQQNPAQAIIIDEKYTEKFADKSIILTGDGYEKTLPYWSNSKILSGNNSTSAAFMALPAQKMYQIKKFSNFFNFSPYYLKSPNITVPGNSGRKSEN